MSSSKNKTLSRAITQLLACKLHYFSSKVIFRAFSSHLRVCVGSCTISIEKQRKIMHKSFCKHNTAQISRNLLQKHVQLNVNSPQFWLLLNCSRERFSSPIFHYTITFKNTMLFSIFPFVFCSPYNSSPNFLDSRLYGCCFVFTGVWQ